MDPAVARSFEAVVVSLRRLRPHVRVTGTTVEDGLRLVTVAPVPKWMLEDLIDSLDHSDCVRADAHVEREEPATASGLRRRKRWERRMRKAAKKINLPKETLP